jgi:hypothetical protein
MERERERQEEWEERGKGGEGKRIFRSKTYSVDERLSMNECVLENWPHLDTCMCAPSFFMAEQNSSALSPPEPSLSRICTEIRM